MAVRRVQVPDSLPPYDCDAASPPAAANLPESASPDGPDKPEASPDEQGDDARDGPGKPGAGPRQALRAPPGPGGWPSQFAQVLAETLAGSRPAQQLAPWTTEQTRQRIRELGPMLSTGQRPRVRRIMASAPAVNVLEMTAVIGFGARVRVLALRLERADEAVPGWQCTAIESA